MKRSATSELDIRCCTMFDLFFIFKISFGEIRLSQDRAKSAKRDFFFRMRYNNSKFIFVWFAIFCVAAFLRNEKEALAFKDFDYMF